MFHSKFFYRSLILCLTVSTFGSLACMSTKQQTHEEKIAEAYRQFREAEDQRLEEHAKAFQETLKAAEAGDHNAQVYLAKGFICDLDKDPDKARGIAIGWLIKSLETTKDSEEIGRIHYEIAKRSFGQELFDHLKLAIAYKNAETIEWVKKLAAFGKKKFVHEPQPITRQIFDWCAKYIEKLPS